jgi:amidophosphoribosyltransferase
MSDSIKHECGIALIRLRKPFQHYLDKYKTPTYGLSKLYLMMEKQVNRGQDGAGVANIKINVKPGHRYISRYRSVEPQAVADIFGKINKNSLNQSSARPALMQSMMQTGGKKMSLSRVRYF